jgi:hypothetical protein
MTTTAAAPLDNEIGLILGRKGTGKTTLARKLATLTKRTLILDTLGTDYGGGVVVSDAGSLVDYFARVRNGPDFCIIARPRDDELPRVFFQLVRNSRNVWAFVEECDRYCSPNDIQPDLNWTINYGRQFGQSLIGCARRAHAINRVWTANADWIVAHQTQEPRDLNYLASYGFGDELKTLEPFKWRRTGKSRLAF